MKECGLEKIRRRSNHATARPSRPRHSLQILSDAFTQGLTSAAQEAAGHLFSALRLHGRGIRSDGDSHAFRHDTTKPSTMESLLDTNINITSTHLFAAIPRELGVSSLRGYPSFRRRTESRFSKMKGESLVQERLSQVGLKNPVGAKCCHRKGTTLIRRWAHSESGMWEHYPRGASAKEYKESGPKSRSGNVSYGREIARCASCSSSASIHLCASRRRGRDVSYNDLAIAVWRLEHPTLSSSLSPL